MQYLENLVEIESKGAQWSALIESRSIHRHLFGYYISNIDKFTGVMAFNVG